MAEDKGTDLNLLKSHVNEECVVANLKVEEVDYEEAINIETEVIGGSWVHQSLHANQLIKNEDEDSNLEFGTNVKQLNEISGQQYLVNHTKVRPYKETIVTEINGGKNVFIFKETLDIKDFEGHPIICEKITNLSVVDEKNIKNGKICDKFDLRWEEKPLGQNVNFLGHQSLSSEDIKFLQLDTEESNLFPVGDLALRRYHCNQCSYSAVRKQHLRSHIKHRHTKEKAFRCKECSYETVRNSQLILHIKYHHTMEKPFKCGECPYTAVLKAHLLCHIKHQHTKEKPFKCNVCPYEAVQKAQLQSHINHRHAMKKLYKCTECSYAAVQKANFLAHIKQHHTREKPHKCNECSYAAVRKDYLLSHIKSCHTTEKPYKCNECSYAAVKKAQLIPHIKRHHST